MDPLKRAASFIAPIRRLPAELLRIILLISYKNCDLSCWKLGWIDSRTRSIVLSTPFFWTTLRVIYVQPGHIQLNSLVEKLRVQLRRCGRVLPLDIFWVTTANEHHLTRLLWLFIEENAPFNRWKTLTVNARGVFPSAMLEQEALGEFTTLQKLYVVEGYPEFFFHHLNKTRDLSNLVMLHSASRSGNYNQLDTAMPRVLRAIKHLVVHAHSDFSSGLPPNIMALECDMVVYPHFPHLKRLIVKNWSLPPDPSGIPLVTHLEIRPPPSYMPPSVLEFPALTSLVIECTLKELGPLTWLSAPNLISIKLDVLSTFKDVAFYHHSLHVSQLDLLRYPCVSNVEIKIPLEFEELSALLPHFPAVRRMVIPLDVPATLEGVESTLFALLHDHAVAEEDGRGKVQYRELEKVVILPNSKEIDAGGWDAIAEMVMKRFSNSKLWELRLGS